MTDAVQDRTLDIPSVAARLNADCACVSLDRTLFEAVLDRMTGETGFGAALAASHPTLLANQPVYLDPIHAAAIADIVTAIETVLLSPLVAEAALAAAPSIARIDNGTAGVFMGYDFHIGADGPKLIEINTNAGGALINAVLASAQSVCCMAAEPLISGVPSLEHVATAFLDSFEAEWRAARGEAPLQTIAIVDQEPAAQYLYPEFVLFRRLFETRGLEALIVPPEALVFRDGRLVADERPIDIAYNRLTDFMLVDPASRALREAHAANAALVTPSPRTHVLLADKRNLALLTDKAWLAAKGIGATTIAALVAGIPKTVVVTSANADSLWQGRSELFFKPFAGFGSRAAYRGDKVTRRVWDSIAAGGYVAQALVPPSRRTVLVDGDLKSLKSDIRAYTYRGQIQLLAARLYEGQTTNMRTPGGGFSPVISGPIPDSAGCGRTAEPEAIAAGACDCQ